MRGNMPNKKVKSNKLYNIGDIVLVTGCDLCGGAKDRICEILRKERAGYYGLATLWREDGGKLGTSWNGCDACCSLCLMPEDYIFIYGQ
jgi:hypothetical protein